MTPETAGDQTIKVAHIQPKEGENTVNCQFLAAVFCITLATPAGADISLTLRNVEKTLEKMPVEKNRAHLALLDQEGEVKVVTIKLDPDRRHVDGFAESIRPKGFLIGWKNLNGFNTPFEVMDPPGYAVIGIKRRLKSRPNESGVYIPYSDAILPLKDLGEVVATHIVNEAYETVHTLNIPSRALPWENVGYLTPPKFAYVMLLNEHIDHDRFASEPLQRLVDEQLAIIGANLRRAYLYAKSSAGALGPWQFMERSYRSMRRLYQRAKLKSDFRKGMADPVNGAVAFYLHADTSLEYLLNTGKRLASNSPLELGRYLAASYNAGPARAVKAIDDDGNLRLELLPAETQVYLRKFEEIWKLVNERPGEPEYNLESAALVSATVR